MAIPTMPLSCWQSTVGVVAHVKLHWKQKTGTCSCLSDYLSAQAALGLWQSSRMQPGAEQLQPIGLPIPGPMQRTQSLMLATCFELPAAEAGPTCLWPACICCQRKRWQRGVTYIRCQANLHLHPCSPCTSFELCAIVLLPLQVESHQTMRIHSAPAQVHPRVEGVDQWLGLHQAVRLM